MFIYIIAFGLLIGTGTPFSAGKQVFFVPNYLFVRLFVCACKCAFFHSLNDPLSVCYLHGTVSTDCSNDFEDGTGSLVGWTKTGNAFDNQPTYGDNLSVRRPGIRVNHHGDFWIGTYENRPKADSPPGMVQSDVPIGTLTSPEFQIIGSDINFLIGGGCDQSKVRVELLVEGSVVEYDTGKCSEAMHRVHWSVGKYKGKTAKIRLVDNSRAGWGHLNFDDLKGDIKCQGEYLLLLATHFYIITSAHKYIAKCHSRRL
jgi:hypothetical protein